MRTARTLAPALLGLGLGLGLALACAGGGPRLDAGAEPTHDGLQPLRGARFGRAWARPGLDLSRYTRIWLVSDGIRYERPPKRAYGSQDDFALAPFQRDALEAELLDALRRAFFADGVWQAAETDGADVLRLRASLIDVVVDVEPEPAGRGRVLIESAGRARLVLELDDSVTRETLLRLTDRGEFEPALGPMRSTAITNRTEVRRTFDAWARLARRRLDELRALRLPEGSS